MTTGARYTRERLAEAATQCSDINEAMAFLGTKPYDHLPRYLMKRFTHFGIDVSHFPAFGRRDRPKARQVRDAVAEAVSVRDALHRLGRTDNAAQRANLRRWVAEEGVSTAHFLGQGHQRGKRGPRAKPPEDVLVRHGNKRRTTTRTLRRALQEIGTPEQCQECGTGPEWLGDSITLEIDHVNGDWGDDRCENLRLLCPNCHAVTDTWCRGGRRVK